MNKDKWIKTCPSWEVALERLTSLTSKSDIQLLPKYDLEDRRTVMVTPENINTSVADLLTFDLLGFDSESRPSFKPGEDHPVSLIQLATPNTCYLFHIKNIMSFNALKPILESKGIKKVGIGLNGDSSSLNKYYGLKLLGTIDLVTLFKRIGRKKGSGAKHLVATLFEQNLQKSKSMSLSNWSKLPYRDSQIKYAAEDAMVPLDVLLFLSELVSSYAEEVPSWLRDDIASYSN